MFTVTSVLKTLRRVDDRIILAVMGRDLDLDRTNACLCGWIVREKLAEVRNVAASTVDDLPSRAQFDGTDAGSRCAKFFGGAPSSWRKIYEGVLDWDLGGAAETCPVIELAFAKRVDEAVFGRRGAR